MSLKKRIEALELKQKQDTCDHYLEYVKFTQDGPSTVEIRATCSYCKKTVSRTAGGEKIVAAATLLRAQIEPRLEAK